MFTDTRRTLNDLLLHLHQSRFLRLPFHIPRRCGTLAGDEWKDDLHNQKGEMVMKHAEAINEIYALVEEAYSENLSENGEPINDTISGNLARAANLLEQLERRIS